MLYIYKLLLNTNFPKGNEVNNEILARILCRSPLQPTGMGCMLMEAKCLTRSVGTFWECERERKLCIKVDLQRETESYYKCKMKKCKEGNCRRHLSQGHLEDVRKPFSCKRVTQRCKLRCWVGTILCTWAINYQSSGRCHVTYCSWAKGFSHTSWHLCYGRSVSAMSLQSSSLLLNFWSPG